MSDDFVYGPFLDEEFFFYNDIRTTLELDAVEIFDITRGFIGLDDLEKMYHLGRSRSGSYARVMFSGVTTLDRASYLCERGFKALLRQVEERDPSMNPDKLRRYCKQGNIKVELHCQLAVMPVCYLTKRLPSSVVMYSRNENNLKAQRRYVVTTFHIGCFRRSELTLHRYMLLKFILDACTRYKDDVPRDQRDVHWLVDVYLHDYAAIFKDRQRPPLHRAAVYDHFATHADWLRNVFSKKLAVGRDSWKLWVEDSKFYRIKARRKKSKWGSRAKRPQDERVEHDDMALDDNTWDDTPSTVPDFTLDALASDSPSASSSEEPLSSSSTEDGDDDNGQVHYAHHAPTLRARTHRGLFNPMPLPTWYWACDIASTCTFTIHLGSGVRVADDDPPCMAPLTPQEKTYLHRARWGLYNRRLGRIWRKMLQAHMDWHWREAGLVLDHERKMIYGVEEEVQDEA